MFEAALRSLEESSNVTAKTACTTACHMAAAVLAPDAVTFRSIAAAYAAQPQLQLQLFALCMSCLKQVRRCVAVEAGAALLQQSVLGTVVDVCKVAGGMADALHSSSSSSSNSSSSSSSSSVTSRAEAAAPWVVLLTRCMLLACDATESIGSWTAADCNVRNAACAANQAAAVCGDSLMHISAYVACQLTAAAAAAPCCVKVMCQLQQMAQASAECEKEAQLACCGGGAAAAASAERKGVQLVANVRKAVQEDGLADELHAYAGLVAALLPLPHACNNPDCVSLQQRSELQLVAVKGSRCSGCKVAR
jgi:hypothetical protein